MYTTVWFVLPLDADTSSVDRLTELHKVGHGLAPWGATTIPGERLFMVNPWKMCHCGWSPAGFRAVVGDTLASRAAPWIGVLSTEEGDRDGPDLGSRAVLTPDDFASGRFDDADVLYMVEPDRTPQPISRRHGPRRRRSKTA
jgi:hypothetical protein